MQSHLAEILENNRAQSGNHTDEDKVEHPFAGRPDLGGSGFEDRVAGLLFLVQRICLFLQCLVPGVEKIPVSLMQPAKKLSIVRAGA